MIQEIGRVHEIRKIRPALFRLLLDLPGIARAARPGQFLHLLAPGSAGVLLRRPFSIAGVRGSIVDLLIRIIGTGTEAISHFAIGDLADAIGPLGSEFERGEAEIHLLVGGGIGAAPLIFLQDELKRAGREITFFLGAKTHSEFPLSEEEIGVRAVVACTDDGSFGQVGFVSKSFESYLKRHASAKARVFSCGPVPMMKEVARICEKYGRPHQASLENRMGCGIGICQGCALKLNKSDERGGFRLICKDGPVFDAADIDWSLIY
ncbi:MAG TPA: dihydroorotate dehydrogenase electron transfer subunit [bacterium]|jgi:dihydroorotate dehydrogenase electron transfer subunit